MDHHLAYFKSAPEAALGIVHRPWFESRLQAHFDGGCTEDEAESSWYALRNAIYACGSRIVLSKESTYQDANRTAWEFFENAMSVHTEIVYYRTSLIGVQALTVMVGPAQVFNPRC